MSCSSSNQLQEYLLDSFSVEWALWSLPRAGHTRPVSMLKQVHSAVLSASRLVVAAEFDLLSLIPCNRILSALRTLQVTDGSSHHGCFRWYAEEPYPVDTNAAFFVGLNLIVLSAKFEDRLDELGRSQLRTMLRDLAVWFDRASQERSYFYPNKFLGDVVCAWLLHEKLGDTAANPWLESVMKDAATYWLEQHWGWGEHMSDHYSAILLNELSCLLLCAKALPNDLKQLYHKMFQELMAIEDAFGGGPRVPAIRSYDFTEPPQKKSFRETVRRWSGIKEAWEDPHQFRFGQLFERSGWHDMVGGASETNSLITVPCFGEVSAYAWVSQDARMGTLSRFPLMPHTDHAGWGLSWQTFPVAFVAGNNGWGFLRWESLEGGILRSHPACDKASAYLANALTDSVTPPIVGKTSAMQDGPDVLVLREMPRLSQSWEHLADQLVLSGSAFSILEEERFAGGARLLFEANGRPVTVFFHALNYEACPKIEQSQGNIRWRVRWTKTDLTSRERVECLWVICWGRDVPLPENFCERVEMPACFIPGQENTWQVKWPCVSGMRPVSIGFKLPSGERRLSKCVDHQ